MRVLVLITALILIGCKQGETMHVTQLKKDDITVINTNATDEHDVAMYNSVNGFFVSGKDYDDKTLLQHNRNIHEINVPPHIEYSRYLTLSEGDIVKYVDEYGRVSYHKAMIYIPDAIRYNMPTEKELDLNCTVGGVVIGQKTIRYRRRIENFSSGGNYTCMYLTGYYTITNTFTLANGVWNMKSVKKRLLNGDEEVVFDGEVKISTIEDYSSDWFIHKSDLFERYHDYDGYELAVDPFDKNYFTTVDILDAYYYSPLNQNKMLDEDINSKTEKEDYLTATISTPAEHLYLYGVTGQRLTVIVDGDVKLDEEIIYSKKGVTRHVELGVGDHTVKIEIVADGMCAIGDIYANDGAAIDFGVTDYKIKVGGYDTSRVDRKPGGVLDIKEGLVLRKYDITVYNYFSKRRWLIELLDSVKQTRAAFDIEDSVVSGEKEALMVIGRVTASGMSIEKDGDSVSEVAPLSFSIEEYA